MTHRHDKRDRADHLRLGLTFLVIGIGVGMAVVRVFKDGDILQTILKFRYGNVFPLLLVCSSIVLLALVLRSFFLYFKSQ